MTREKELIQLFGSRATELDALEALIGGITTTHLRTVCLTEWVLEALVESLSDPNPRVRWWCVQLLDQSPDLRAISALVPMLDDRVPRVRQNAAHALGCLACKPDGSGGLPVSVIERLRSVATADEYEKVRRHASWALPWPSANSRDAICSAPGGGRVSVTVAYEPITPGSLGAEAVAAAQARQGDIAVVWGYRPVGARRFVRRQAHKAARRALRCKGAPEAQPTVNQATS